MTTFSLPTKKGSSLQRVDISVWAEEFLMRLLGQPIPYIHGWQDKKTWKKILQRLAESVDKAIKRNVKNNDLHTLKLGDYSKQLKKATQYKDYSQPEIVLPLIGIISELLGGATSYRDRPRINRRNDYALSGLRELEYRQPSFQKTRTILKASKQRPFYGIHHYDDLFEVYLSKFNKKSEEFIQWYK